MAGLRSRLRLFSARDVILREAPGGSLPLHGGRGADRRIWLPHRRQPAWHGPVRRTVAGGGRAGLRPDPSVAPRCRVEVSAAPRSLRMTPLGGVRADAVLMFFAGSRCHSEGGARRIVAGARTPRRRPKNLVATPTAAGMARSRPTDRRGRRSCRAATRSFGRATVPCGGECRAALPQDDTPGRSARRRGSYVFCRLALSF